MKEQFLLTEKYRPKTVDECILPERLKVPFRKYVKTGEVPNLLLSGGPGVGKTTIARAMCEEIGCSYMIINSSDERGIDTLRTKIKTYASTSSLGGGRKVVIMDEADYLTNDAQAALRGVIEEFSSNCTFIFTCNFKSKVMGAIDSRTIQIDFTLKNANNEKADMALEFFKRILTILKAEGIEYDSKAVGEIVTKYFPDYRKTLNVIQHVATFGKIDSSAISNVSIVTDIKELFKHLRDKNYPEIRKWLSQNNDVDYAMLYKSLYSSLETYMKKLTIPIAIIILAKYQYQAAFCSDQELNTLACLTEIMMECEFNES